MSITIQTFVLGPIQNNTYLVVDDATRAAAIIDPSVPSNQIAEWLSQNDAVLKYILITHAHFDHIGGVEWVQSLTKDHIPVTLHALDKPLWLDGGGAKNFGFEFDPGEAPDMLVEDQQTLSLGNSTIKVLFTPGHSTGHVTYAFPQDQVAFCGDLIFYHSVGRTDLDDGNSQDLTHSIHEKIFTLPDDTVLYPGHGQATTVKEEKENNPFI